MDGVAWIPDADGHVRRYGPGASPKPFASGVGNPVAMTAPSKDFFSIEHPRCYSNSVTLPRVLEKRQNPRSND